MDITVISVGKIKEKYFTNLIDAHAKNIRKYGAIELIEVADEKCPEKLSEKEMIAVKDKEGQRILDRIPDRSHIIALAIDGKMLDTQAFAKKINQNSSITFIIGGSLGLSDQVLNKAHFKISFSKMTFPHQLMKVMLMEQIEESMKHL